MFTHLVTLKKKPYFIYAEGKEDAISICEEYKDNIVGVVYAPEGLIMQEIKTEVSLVTPDIRDLVLDKDKQLALDFTKEEDNEPQSLE